MGWQRSPTSQPHEADSPRDSPPLAKKASLSSNCAFLTRRQLACESQALSQLSLIKGRCSGAARETWFPDSTFPSPCPFPSTRRENFTHMEPKRSMEGIQQS